MLKRAVTGLLILVLVVTLVFFGGIPLVVFCAIAALAGLKELYTALSGKHQNIHWVGYLFTVLYFAALYVFSSGYLQLILQTIFILVVQTCLVLFFKKLTLKECITTVYGFLYIPFLLAFLIMVREHELGTRFVWLIFTSAFACDTFAYLTGVTIGKHKLKNSPSPVKSIEGLFGGVIGAAIVGGLFGFFLSRFTDLADTSFILQAVIISVIGAMFCIVGDMTASAIKRNTGIKDFGNIFPGHGGVVDRLDSILFTSPAVYMAMSFLIWLGVA